MAKQTVIGELVTKIKLAIDESSKAQAKSEMSELKSFAMKTLGALGIGFSVAQLKSFAQDCVQVASDVQEMEGKADVVFGKFAKDADEWAESYSNSIGRSKSDIKTYITDMQNLLTGFTNGSDEAREACMKLSEAATSLAIDNAPFDNTDEQVSVDRMTKAIMGQTEAARMMGAILDDNTRAEAMNRMGIQGTYEALDQYTKMTVNLNALQYQMKDAIGDCERSMSRYEGQTRQLSAAQKDFKEYVGNQLIPVMNKVRDIQIWFEQSKLKFAKFLFEDIAGALGGVENMLKLVAIAAASLIIALNISKITSFLTSLSALLSPVTLKILAIAAAIAAVFLIIDDIATFLSGGDSLIGDWLESIGVDTEQLRNDINDFIDNVGKEIDELKNNVKNFWGEVTKGFDDFVQKLNEFQENFEKDHPILSRLLGLKRGEATLEDYEGKEDDPLLKNHGKSYSSTTLGVNRITESEEDAETNAKIADTVKSGAGSLWNGTKLVMGVATKRFLDGADLIEDMLGGIGKNSLVGRTVPSTVAAKTIVPASNVVSKNYNIKQENNQQYKFEVHERNIADGIYNRLTSQDSQNTDNLARAIATGG